MRIRSFLRSKNATSVLLLVLHLLDASVRSTRIKREEIYYLEERTPFPAWRLRFSTRSRSFRRSSMTRLKSSRKVFSSDRFAIVWLLISPCLCPPNREELFRLREGKNRPSLLSKSNSNHLNSSNPSSHSYVRPFLSSWKPPDCRRAPRKQARTELGFRNLLHELGLIRMTFVLARESMMMESVTIFYGYQNKISV